MPISLPITIGDGVSRSTRSWAGDAGCLPLSVDGQKVGEQRSTYKLPLLVRRIVLHFPQRHIV